MKPVSSTSFLAAAWLAIVCAASAQQPLQVIPQPAPLPLPTNVRILFSPQQDLDAAVATAIAQARTEILVNQWAITSRKIAQALVDAFQDPKRKIVVGIILDENPAIVNYQAPDYFALNRIPFVFAPTKGRHNRNYCVIDRRIVLTGSYEWLATAASNNQTLVVVDDAGVAAAFVRNWLDDSQQAKVPHETLSKIP